MDTRFRNALVNESTAASTLSVGKACNFVVVVVAVAVGALPLLILMMRCCDLIDRGA